MAKFTFPQYQSDAHGKSLWAKAELGVAEALSVSRADKDLHKEVIRTFKESTQHIGSFFYTTDQITHNYVIPSEAYWGHSKVKARMASDNMTRDIDLWCTSLHNSSFGQRTQGLKYSVSVKAQTRALSSNNVSLELETFNDDGRTRQGWYTAGQADFYAFVIGHKVLVVTKEKLQYLTDTGCYRTIGRLTAAAKATNAGRTYNDAKNLLVPVKHVAEIGAVLDMPEWYVTAFKAKNKVQAYKDSVAFWADLGYE